LLAVVSNRVLAVFAVAVDLPLAARSRAAPPATKGVAIDVPDLTP